VLPERDSLEIPHRDTVFATRWSDGPYAQAARELASESAATIERMLESYDELAARVPPHGWVVTHGEPHAGNVMLTHDGAIRLIDWDTVRLGPRERDLWMIEPRDEADWAAYGLPRPDPGAMRLYREWWALSEICGFIATFQKPHADDENTRLAWRELRNYLTSKSSSHAITVAPDSA
jgi:spectinomycin phosphotransferase